ncbi:D-alanyl-D-alanine carboxypeptidase [Bartonella sp. TP]|uniref:D-alanyl-D-alanine carboxypeptidase n=1 Tax=Bartonella sp. TP TaxID=3057550 RepID=UPI0025AFADCD|nr:D-alanyl-D-alanine carboxypeptidase [Bartonella sp. TP]WJW79868.1 D-alanyl-D-alanine carboxypeptidase [Bartonella sp. TP]
MQLNLYLLSKIYQPTKQLRKLISLYLIFTLPLINYVTAAPKSAFADRYAEIVIDANSGKTLFFANENARRYPASLTKMMTLYLLFNALQAGRLSPNTPIPISHFAATRPPTKIGFTPGQTITVQDAAEAIIIKSANDVAVGVAEYLGGDEKNFAEMMTSEAHKLGMMNTHFNNASGLPDINNYTTARDLATLALSLRRHFPKFYYLFKITSFGIKGKIIHGHNKLIKTMQGVDGIKTGYTQMSGYNLATSYYAHGKNVVAVIMGARSPLLRDARMATLLHKFVPQAKTLLSSENQLAIAEQIPTPSLKKAQPLALVSALQASQESADAAKSNHTYAIQIGATTSLASAKAIYRKAIKHHKNLFANTKQQISSITKNKRKYYRVRITNFSSQDAGLSACQILKKEKFNCYVIQ